jgi:hypothetical protein
MNTQDILQIKVPTASGIIIPKLTANFGQDLKFEFELKARKVLVLGESGTGKSLFRYIVQNTCKESIMNPELGKLRSEIVVYDFHTGANDLYRCLLSRQRFYKLIIIDDADMLVTEQTASLIAKDQTNQYLIFGRDTDLYSIPIKDRAFITEDGNKRTLRYITDQMEGITYE